MKGSYQIIIQNSLVQFKLRINRNITIIRGDSGTGKTTMVNLVRQYSLDGAASGVNISCDKTCTVLSGLRWENEIKSIHDSIIFLDEGFSFISSKEFARAVKTSDNYFVIATRETLFNLPYSIKEIYGLKNVTRKTKYQEFNRIYSEFYPIYDEKLSRVKPDTVIVEDSNSGYQFFSALCNREKIRCISAKGKTKIYDAINKCKDKVILVIADGAAFGPEMERVISLGKTKNLIYFLPESFEWLILKSGLIDGSRIQDILDHPYDFIESKKYFSWERFFTALLTDETKDTYMKYSKSELNTAYLNQKEVNAIKGVVKEMVDGA